MLDSAARIGWLLRSLYHLFVPSTLRASAAAAKTYAALQHSPEYEWLAERQSLWQ